MLKRLENPSDYSNMVALLEAVYSDDFIGHIQNLYYLVNDVHPFPVIESYINNSFIPDNSLTGLDIQARDVFIDVLLNSRELWLVKDAQLACKKWGETEWKYFNDALGGVLGLPFGGVGSVIMASALSYATEKEYQRGRQ